MVDKVVGEELSEPTLEARLDVMLEVKLEARGFTVENIELCIWTNQRISGLAPSLKIYSIF